MVSAALSRPILDSTGTVYPMLSVAEISMVLWMEGNMRKHRIEVIESLEMVQVKLVGHYLKENTQDLDAIGNC
jgi:hypothetical protein